MKNKLKELARYCCKPNEQEYEFIKTCARLGGVEFNTMPSEKYAPKECPYVFFSNKSACLLSYFYAHNLDQIPVTQFCEILLKAETEFDDRVEIMDNSCIVDNGKALSAVDGYKFRLSEDCKTVEMVKDEVKCGFCVKPKNEKG